MRIPLPIETHRLVLRAFDPSADADEMTAVYCDPEVMRLIPGGPLAGRSAVRDELRRHVADQAERGFAFWAVVERASTRVVGDAGFGIFAATGDLELGYTLARDVWGRGYATEVAQACLAAGFEHLDVNRIVAVIDEENEASQRVATRIGMTLGTRTEAHGRPHLLFARSRDG
jgi:ribosomal-protein-alanine N-acetyltransferase